MASGPKPRKRSKLFRAFERAVLGAGMTIVAWFIERRLITALKKGSVEPAPRTAAEFEPEGSERELLTAAPHQVGDQADR